MSQENCYHSFDTLLLIDWIKATKGDLTRLRISGGTPELDADAWESINEEHAEHFGSDSKHIAYIRLVKKLSMYELDYVIKEDAFILNHIEICKEQLEVLLKSLTQDNGSGVSETLFALSERAGYMVTETNITAKKYFEMVKYYTKKQ